MPSYYDKEWLADKKLNLLNVGGVRMADQEGKYNIKAAASILGIQPGTLRAWERRYQMIAPVRNEAGHRLYTDEHIKTLKWLIKKVNQGFTISQAISLMDQSQSPILAGTINFKQNNQLDRLSDELFEALIHFDEIKANEILNSMFSVFFIEKTVFDIFNPLLKKITDSCESGKILNAQKHYARLYIHTRTAMLIQGLPYNSNSPKVITVNYPEDQWNFNMLMITFLLRSKGLKVINVGTNVSIGETEEVLNIFQPDLLIIFCKKTDYLKALMPYVTHLALNHKELMIGLAGEVFQNLEDSMKNLTSVSVIGKTKNEWEKWLMERMGV